MLHGVTNTLTHTCVNEPLHTHNGNMTDFIFLCSKITARCDCSHQIKRHMLLRRNAMTNLDYIKKQRHYFADKGLYSQSYGISSRDVWMRQLDHKESWAPRTDAFELWCWRRLLRVLWTARRSSQCILKEISLKQLLEGLMLKLKLQYFDHLMRRTNSLEQTLMLGKTEGRRRGEDRGWDGSMGSLTWWTRVWERSGSWWWTGKPGMLQSMGL